MIQLLAKATHQSEVIGCRREFRRPVPHRIATLAVTAYAILFVQTIDTQSVKAESSDRPNIIFVMADDLGYADLGCYGQEEILTPHIDQLAMEGTRFTQVYAGSPVCAPSRSVLMTGQHTGHTTVRGNFGKGGVDGIGGGSGRVPLKADDVTVAEVLQQAGYTTAMTGKWGLGEPGTSGLPTLQGFDQWFGYLNQRRAHSYYPGFVWRNGEKYPLPGNQNGSKQQYTHDLFADFALEFIRSHADPGGHDPFFLYLPFTIPHAAYEIPSTAPYDDRDWTHDQKVHAAMVTRMDGDIGAMMETLQETGIDRQTVVFFCSDNGAARRWEKVFDSSGPLRGQKRSMYEGGIRTPMIVRWPGQVPAGRVDRNATWYFADVLPTLAELGGASSLVPQDVDGISVVPTLMGQSQPQLRERFLYWEFFERGFQQAVRWGDWKAVRQGQDEPLELYALDSDPGEENNVAQDHPELIDRITRYLNTARTPSQHWPVAD